MKSKKPASVWIFLTVTIIVYLAASVTLGYTTKPAISNGEFPFAITYAYKGETGTLSGVLKCEYAGSYTIHGEHHRYWNEETIYDNPDNVAEPFVVEQNDELQTTLYIHENMSAGYFMGDPLYRDYYEEYGLAGVEPHIAYYDYKNDISLEEGNAEEILADIGFEILECTYAEPMENRFSLAGIWYEADNVILLAAIMLVLFLLGLIFVRKDKAYRYSGLDKAGIVLNFLVGIGAVPFVTVYSFMYGLVESSSDWINQITYNIPAVTILCLALSVMFRRKGYSKTGFLVQFGGIVLFGLMLALGAGV